MTVAEQRLHELESRLIAVERVGAAATQGDADDGAVQAYQAVVLDRLKSIRHALLEEVGDIAAIRRERDEAVALNVKMEADLAKQNYRIAHLIKALNEAQQK